MLGEVEKSKGKTGPYLLRWVPAAAVATLVATFAVSSPVAAAPAPVVVSSSASPSSLTIGTPTTISWEVTSSSALTENRAFLYSPADNELPPSDCGTVTQISGTSTDGHYQQVCTIPNGFGNGIYPTHILNMDSTGDGVLNTGPQITVTGEPVSGQTISYTSTAPTGAVVGGNYTPAAMASSGLPVTITLDSMSKGCS